PKCNLIGINNAIEVLRIANRLRGAELYRWQLITKDASPITVSNGITLVPDYGIKTAPKADLVLVCASYDAHILADSTICQYIHRLARHGVALGGIGQGSYVLARAGLLEGYRCTIHWEQRPSLVEDFPGLEVTSNLYEIDRDRMTCGGGTAALD